jgi:hypothetical protein
VDFSLRNVLKREYNGFFAIFVSFALVEAAHNLRQSGFDFSAQLLNQHWVYMLAGSAAVFLILRTLKKRTKVLDVRGREFLVE